MSLTVLVSLASSLPFRQSFFFPPRLLPPPPLPASSVAMSAAAAAVDHKKVDPSRVGPETTHLGWVQTSFPQRKNKVALITGITGQGQAEWTRDTDETHRESAKAARATPAWHHTYATLSAVAYVETPLRDTIVLVGPRAAELRR